MAKIKLKPMDHMYDRRGRHLMNTITQMPTFVSEDTEVEIDDDVAEAVVKYIEENRKNASSYIRPMERLEERKISAPSDNSEEQVSRIKPALILEDPKKPEKSSSLDIEQQSSSIKN